MPVSLFPLHCHQVTLYRWLTERDKPPVKYCLRCLKRPPAEWSLLSLTKPFMFYSPLVDECRRQDEPQAACSSLTRPESIRQNAGLASLWEPRQKRTLIRPPFCTFPHWLNDLEVHKAGVYLSVSVWEWLCFCQWNGGWEGAINACL